MTRSQHLSARQRHGLLKVGDVLIAGDYEFPSFTGSGSAEHAERMLDYMNESDRNGLTVLLGLFRFVPRWLLRVLFFVAERHRFFPRPVGGALRMINIGVKGTVMTLYYSDVGRGPSIHGLIKWDARIVETAGASGERR